MTVTVQSAEQLIALALKLNARAVSGWSKQEEKLAQSGDSVPANIVRKAQTAIGKGTDVLGDAFCLLRAAEERRELGAVYTPEPLVSAMLNWAERYIEPVRVVDPGVGSARFLVAAGHRFPRAQLVGIEIDPLAALLARGHLAAAGMAERARVLCKDYRSVPLPSVDGPTLYIGNPPYVRHHNIETEWKQWLTSTAKLHGYDASQLSGLHVHFFLRTATLAAKGDVGVFVTASEWLDVNYGRLVRQLLLRDLGVKSLVVVEPTAQPFPGTATTAVITGFEAKRQPEHVEIQRTDSLAQLGDLRSDVSIRRERLEGADRWTPLTRAVPERREGFIELGELFRVHRGQVTGANKVWIAGAHSRNLPVSVLFPTVTRARELFRTGGELADNSWLRQVIDIPGDLDVLPVDELRQVERFLKYAKAHGAADGYIARHRKAWWSVGLRAPAPILATYMARRPPTFVRNTVEARHINIAHGLYPRDDLSERVLLGVASYLTRHVRLSEGRTYAGGLTKFEPREMERLLIPAPEVFEHEVAA